MLVGDGEVFGNTLFTCFLIVSLVLIVPATELVFPATNGRTACAAASDRRALGSVMWIGLSLPKIALERSLKS